MKMVAERLIKPTSGEILYDGIDKNDIAIVYNENENTTLLNNYEYLMFYGKCYGVNKEEIKNRIEYYLLKYNIYNLKHVSYDDLSKSKKKIINLLSVLIADTKVVILDEIYKDVFIKDKDIIKTMLMELIKTRTVIATCDALDDYIDMASKIAIIDKGTISICGDAKDALVQYGYKEYLEVYYEGEIEDVVSLLRDMDNIKDYTYDDKKINIVTYDFGRDHEILKVLIDHDINITSFKREEKR
ncbi:MAG: hypothetical protein MJ151_04785 [Lachnospiraceae bacterium]|nr:hypothetical protein [Lachnospiraceae bacterium]